MCVGGGGGGGAQVVDHSPADRQMLLPQVWWNLSREHLGVGQHQHAQGSPKGPEGEETTHTSTGTCMYVHTYVRVCKACTVRLPYALWSHQSLDDASIQSICSYQ